MDRLGAIVKRWIAGASLALALGAGFVWAGEVTITAESGALQEFKGFGIHPTFTKYKDKFRDTLNALVVKDLKLTSVRFYVEGTDADSIMRNFDANYKYPSGGNTIDDFRKQNDKLFFCLGSQEQVEKEEKIAPWCERWSEVVRRVREDLGFDVQWATLTNEPNDKGKVWKNQDSSQMICPPRLYCALVKQMRAAFDAKGLTGVKLYGPETSSVDDLCFEYIDSVRNDPEAIEALGGYFSKAYNMCSDYTMKEIVEETGLPYFTAAGANLIDWWQFQSIGATAANCGAEKTPNNDNWAAEMAGRILNDFNHMVTYWLTYLPAGEVDIHNRFAAHNLMQYFNSIDTLRLRGYDPALFQVLGNNEAYLQITLKYWYLKHLAHTFDVGCRFRYCSCDPPSPYEDMVMTYGQKPAVCASVAQNSDNTWTIAVVNLTGCDSDKLPTGSQIHPSAFFTYYPAAAYDVTVKVQELEGTGTKKMAMVRSSKTQHGEFEDSVEVVDGECTIQVGAKELVTLRGAATVTATNAPAATMEALPAVRVEQASRGKELIVRAGRSGDYSLALFALDGTKVFERSTIHLEASSGCRIPLDAMGRRVYVLQVTREHSPDYVTTIALR